MEKSKLISLLKTFSKDEYRRFGQFICSPYFNSEVVLIKFYDELKNFFPEFDSENFSKKYIHSRLYPGRPYRDELMRNIISDMLFFAEEFLIYNHVDKKPFQKKISLLRELTNKRQTVLFNKNYRQSEALLSVSKIKDENYYFNLNLLRDEKTWNIQYGTSRVDSTEDNLDEAAEAFVHYVLVEIVKYYAIMLNQKKYIYDINYDVNFLEETISFIEKNKDLTERIPYLYIYHNSIMLFKTEEKKYFDNLRKGISKYFELLNPIDRKNIYIALVNHCAEQINKGSLEFINEKFNIYKELISKKIHYEGSKFISHILFINVVTNSLELHKFRWCNNFIKKYCDDILIEFRDDTFHFCKAMVHFEGNNFDRSLIELSKVRYSDKMFKWYVNCLELMIYFSTDSTEPFSYLIDSFRHVLSNKKLFSKRRRELMGRFITTINKLFKLKNSQKSNSDFEIQSLKTEIQKIDYVFGKNWLLKKVNELIAYC